MLTQSASVAIQIDGVNLGLVIERQVVGLFGHQNLNEGGAGRQSAFDQCLRRR
jgi:hypothetical protein